MIHKLILCCAELHHETKETSERGKSVQHSNAYKTRIVPLDRGLIWNCFRIVSGHHENCSFIICERGNGGPEQLIDWLDIKFKGIWEKVM